MTGLRTLLRALFHRVGTSLVILIVSLCASAAATIGPTYYVAAKHSILQDTVASVSVVGRGIRSVEQGQVQAGVLDSVATGQASFIADAVGGQATANRMFGAPVEARQTFVFFHKTLEQVLLAWRTDVCDHVHVRAGRCPSAAWEVMISSSLAAANKWQVGQIVSPKSTHPLTITGIYDAPSATQDYWFASGSTYFPNEQPTPQAAPFDALFTPVATLDALSGNPQGQVEVERTLQITRLTATDVDRLSQLATAVAQISPLSPVVTLTGVDTTAASVHASWRALAVPVLVVTTELLVLTWLLLFLIVTDAVEARGTEIALAKLRGYGTARTAVFGIGEPAALLAVALPAGAIIGWLVTHVLASVLLISGTPVGLPVVGWLGAAVAILGGVAAVVVAARRTLTRPVVDEWRGASRRANDRSWLFDAVILTLSVAALVQLEVSGTLSSTKHSALALVVPGALGLAVAVVASRLLPVVCRLAFARTRTRGSLGPFLAVRHIARRPGGTRTTMILGTAVALATFSIAAWSVSAQNRGRVAQVTVGAPTVLSVVPPSGGNLAAAVDRADPSGRHAAAVESYFSGSQLLLAVEPGRFARVANWSAADVKDPGSLLTQLHPQAPPSMVLRADALRIHARVGHLSAPAALTVDVVASTSAAPTPIAFGTVHAGEVVDRVADLSGCPCVVTDVQLSSQQQISGTVTLQGFDTRSNGAWHPVQQVTDARRWADSANQNVTVRQTSGGLQWSFVAIAKIAATLSIVDRPQPLPGIVAARAAPAGAGTMTANGLDGANLEVSIVGRVPEVPSAAQNGIIVDLDYASRAAYQSITPATPAVWVRGSTEPIIRSLERSGVTVVSSQSSSAFEKQLSRQGPALASVLFLADAAAAAILAGLAVILSLSAAARRRRYEYAALRATGADERTLFTALAMEQVAVVGFGTLAGVAAGLMAVSLAGHNVPEFVNNPGATLDYSPSAVLLVVLLGLGFCALLAAALLAAGALLRTVTSEQLREAPT